MAALAIAGLAATAAHSQTPSISNSYRDISVSIVGFIDFQFQSPVIVVNGHPGGIAMGTVGFIVKSNGNFAINVRPVIKPTTYSGPATFTASSSISQGPAGTATTGNISVTVSGIALRDRPGSYQGGRIVVDISQI